MSGRREILCVAAALAAMAALLDAGRRGDGLTNDEVLYIAAAHRYVSASDFRLNPTMPPFAKLVIGAGLAGGGWQAPPLRPHEDEMSWSYRFVHEANDAGRLLRRARNPVLVVTLLLALVIWAWVREAAGPGAALVALVLAAFHPTLLAHGHLATTDVVAAAAMLTASWCAWRWCRRPSVLGAALTGLALGAAVATRLTAWLLAPCLLALAMTAAGTARPTLRQRAGFLAALAAAVPLVIWAAHGFHRRPWPGAPAEPEGGAASGVVSHLAPEAYVEGIRYQIAHGTQGHPAYLLGETSHGGWRHYFVVAFAVKNTPGFLLATLAGVVAAWSGRRAGGRQGTAWHTALPAAVVFVAASAQRIDIGERYILPVYPYLIVLAAVSCAAWRRSRRARAAAAAVLVLHVLPSVAATPGGHLTYFNLLAGGPHGGHRVLLDSNLDWGQDLPRLAAWMRRQGVRTIQLGYHGSDRPARLGIGWEDLPGVTLYPPRPPSRPFEGVVAVSPNLLMGLFPRLGDPYHALRERPPDDRAGTFFIYFLDGRPPAVGATGR